MRRILSPSLMLLLACACSALVACSSGDSDSAGSDGGNTKNKAGSAGKSGAGGQGGKSGGGAGGNSSGSGGTAGSAGQAAGGQGGAGASAGPGGSAGAGTPGPGGSAGSQGGSDQGGQGGSSQAGSGGSSQAGSGGSGGSAQAGSGGSGPVDPGPATGLILDPGQGSILWNGSAQPLQFVAKPVYQDLSTGPAIGNAVWKVNFGDIAQVSSTGLLTATGQRAGDVTVTASWNGFDAEAVVTVKFEVVNNPESIADPAKSALDGASSPDGSIVWNYPYNGTVFPRGLLPPKMMWNGSNPGEPMSVSLSNKWLSVTTYFTSTGQDYTLPQQVWDTVTEAGTGGPMQVQVNRFSNGAATQVMNHTWNMASGSLRGTVYYWANSLGRVLRIKPGATAPDDFLAAAGVTSCTTCHAVSANGSTLVIGGDDNTSTFDLLNNKPVFSNTSVGKTMRNWAMPAVSPSGKFLVENNAPLPGPPGGSDGFWNTTTGAKMTGAGLDGMLLDMPAFAPNGSRLIFVDHNTLGLARFDYSEAGDVPAASNRVDLLPATQGQGSFAFPSVSPNGSLVVYHRGALDTRAGFGDLLLANADSPGVEIPLDALNGTSYPFAAGDRDRHYNYEPTFMPVAAGGYFWVVFTSRRTYGNQLVGAKDAVKQIWVAAIDQNPQPGQDPSHPAFWVSGQDPNTLNMRAFWALDPCKQDGASCEQGSQCCSTSCDAATKTCGPPPGQTCKPVGSACTDASECCFASDGYQCLGGYCTENKPLHGADGPSAPARAAG